MVEQEWLNLNEAARYAGVTRMVIRGWIRDKGLPAHQIPWAVTVSRLRISKTDLDRFIRGETRRESFREVTGD